MPTRTKSQRSAGRQRSGKKYETLAGGQIQGRAGESLPSHEKTVLGDEQDWEREDERGAPSPARPRRSGRTPRVREMEYERGPGSKFDIEGRGAPRSKRQQSRR